MTDITADQISDFRNDIGDTGSSPAFGSEEIERLWERVDEDYDKMVLLGIDQLLGNTWKFNAYSQGSSRESKEQIFANLLKLRAVWQEKVNKTGSQVRILGRRTIPPVYKRTP